MPCLQGFCDWMSVSEWTGRSRDLELSHSYKSLTASFREAIPAGLRGRSLPGVLAQRCEPRDTTRLLALLPLPWNHAVLRSTRRFGVGVVFLSHVLGMGLRVEMQNKPMSSGVVGWVRWLGGMAWQGLDIPLKTGGRIQGRGLNRHAIRGRLEVG